MTLRWDDLGEAATDTFGIWTSRSDLHWARETWLGFEKLGFCDYGNETERLIVIGRWLALASIYRDWCAVMCDESHDDTPGYWVEGLEVHDLYLGQLVSGECLSDDPDEARWDALGALMRTQRDAVVSKLRELHGDNALLFMSFWKSANPWMASDDEDDSDADERAAEALNDPTPENVAAWGWLEDGCPHVRPD